MKVHIVATIAILLTGCQLPDFPKFPTLGDTGTSSNANIDWTSKSLKNCRAKPTVYCVSHYDYEPLGRNHLKLTQSIKDICHAVDMRVARGGKPPNYKK